MQGMITETKNFVQFAPDQDGIQTDADQAAGQAVVHQVVFFNSAPHFLQTVLMMPKAVRPLVLLVHKKEGGATCVISATQGAVITASGRIR